MVMLAILAASLCTGAPEGDWTILIGQGAPEIERTAASALALHVGEMTSRRAVVASTAGSIEHGPVGTFLLGSPGTNPAITALFDRMPERRPALEAIGEQGFAIRSVDDDGRSLVVMFGAEPRSVLWAVYDYLEYRCDCGFFMDGDYVPRRSDIPLTGLDKTTEPFFRDRHFGLSNPMGFAKYFFRFKTNEEIEQYTGWMAKRKMNLTAWYMGTLPDSTGIVSADFFNYRLEPEELYHGGWPGGWDLAPKYRTEYIRHFLNTARDQGIKVFYGITPYEVPRQFRDANPDEPYVPNLGYDANYLRPESERGRQLTKQYLTRLIEVYGTDHMYACTPFVESMGAGTPEESFQIKLEAAKKLNEILGEIDPDYTWISDSWDMGAVPQVWTMDRVQTYFESLPKERCYMYDTASVGNPFWKRTNFFGGIDWAFGILHAFQGDDHLHGDMARAHNSILSAVNDPGSDRLRGLFHIPESNGHNMLFFQWTTEHGWDPNGTDLDSFLEHYAVTRYGRSSKDVMLPCTKRVAEAVLSGGGMDMYYQRMGIRYNPPASPPFDDFQQTLGSFEELKREIAGMQQAVTIALQAREAQRDNSLYENDMVDYTKTLLGLKSNYFIVLAYYAFKQGDKAGFQQAASNCMQCLDAIQDILSTRPDFSLEVMINRLMSIPGTNPRLPRMVRQHCINDMYAPVENYEQLALFSKPRVKAYLDAMSERLDQGITAFGRNEMDETFGRLDERWRHEPAVCPPEWRYKGTTMEAILDVYDLLPLTDTELGTALLNRDFQVGQQVSMTPKSANGMLAVSHADGVLHDTTVDGQAAWVIGQAPNGYLYVQISDKVAFDVTRPVVVTVTYRGDQGAQLFVEYDGDAGSYTSTSRVTIEDAADWKTVRYRLDDARFVNSQNSGADLRLTPVGGQVYIREVAVGSAEEQVIPTFEVVHGGGE